ncbi:inner-membrane translocator [Streptomyces pilosus]|nr:inner-membrane translocator [Streptomyces pilosus]
MPERAGEQPTRLGSAATTGCLLLLVLLADAAAGALVVLVLAVRGLGRLDAAMAYGATGGPPPDWGPLTGFGVLALAVGATAFLLMRTGERVAAAVQLTFCVVVAVHALRFWP